MGCVYLRMFGCMDVRMHARVYLWIYGSTDLRMYVCTGMFERSTSVQRYCTIRYVLVRLDHNYRSVRNSFQK